MKCVRYLPPTLTNRPHVPSPVASVPTPTPTPCRCSSKLSVPLDKLLLFWQGKELTAAYDAKTLLELNLHTGAVRCGAVCCACRHPATSDSCRSDGEGMSLQQSIRVHPPPTLLAPAGFSLTGYDLSVEPDFWPAVVETPEGRRIVTGQAEPSPA